MRKYFTKANINNTTIVKCNVCHSTLNIVYKTEVENGIHALCGNCATSAEQLARFGFEVDFIAHVMREAVRIGILWPTKQAQNDIHIDTIS